jgi:nitric oxide dioxygenase
VRPTLLAGVLIAREESIYRGLAAAPGGWTAWRDFVVDSTEPEGDVREMLAMKASGWRCRPN